MTAMCFGANRLTSVKTLASCTKSDLNYLAMMTTSNTMDGFCQRYVNNISVFSLLHFLMLTQCCTKNVQFSCRILLLSMLCPGHSHNNYLIHLNFDIVITLITPAFRQFTVLAVTDCSSSGKLCSYALHQLINVIYTADT